MEYEVSIEGRELRIEVLDEAQVRIVELQDGEPCGEPALVAARLVPGTAGRMRFEREGRQRELVVLGDGINQEVYFSGRRALHAKVLDELSRHLHQGGSDGGASGAVVSAMPGIVLEVHVQVGDSVQKGDALLIVEAMKTENEIKAELDGVVTKVHVAAQDTIPDGAPLIDIEPAEA